MVHYSGTIVVALANLIGQDSTRLSAICLAKKKGRPLRTAQVVRKSPIRALVGGCALVGEHLLQSVSFRALLVAKQGPFTFRHP